VLKTKKPIWVDGAIVETVTLDILSIERITQAYTLALHVVYPLLRIIEGDVCVYTRTDTVEIVVTVR
jgi:hypothetical protein